MRKLRGVLVCSALVLSASRLVSQAVPSDVGVGPLLSLDQRSAPDSLTIDPIVQQAYLKASNTDAFDEFGFSVAASGDTVVVGTFGEDSTATGVNGDQSSNGAGSSGAVYVFVRSGTGWSQQAYLKASNTEESDFFGVAVAVSRDTIVVGASGEDSNATGVNGDQSNNSAPFAGAAYVFVRSGTSWSQQAYLKASNAEGGIPFGDFFGSSVAVSGDTIVVGATGEDSSATGVNGDQGSNGADDAGAAYVFVRNGTTWSQQAYLKASNGEAGDSLGGTVAVSGDTVVVGAVGESSAATGVNGDQGSNDALAAGAAYVFVRSGATWSQQAYLKASNTGAIDQFGSRLAVSADTIVVGAAGEDSNATGVNGDQSDDSILDAGAAYVFARSGTTWSQQAYLKASNTGVDQFGFGDLFSSSVAASGDTAVIGAYAEASNATGVNGNQNNDLASLAGAAYVFTRNGTTWSQHAYLKASNTGVGDLFGKALALSNDTLVVGADSEASNATGVNGNQNNNSFGKAGAAYVFDLGLSPDTWTDLGLGLAGVTGIPSLIGTGPLVGDSPGALTLANASASSPAVLFLSFVSTPASFKGGTLVPVPVSTSFASVTDVSGALLLPFHMPTDVPMGAVIYLQYAIQDSIAVQGVSLSNALKATTP